MKSNTGPNGSKSPGSPTSSKGRGRSGERGTTNLVTLGSAAVIAIYAAGFLRTKPAADRMAAESAASVRRRPTPVPDSASSAAPVPELAVATLQAPPVAADTSSPTAPTKPVPAVVTKAKPRPIEPAAVVVKDSAIEKVAPIDTGTTASPPITQTAEAIAAPAAAPVAPAKPVYHDGVYEGRGRSRHGDIEATVEIKEGRIVGAVISQCLTRYSCSWVSHLLPQVVSRQSAEVDYVSGATESANALYYAVLQALSQAK